jgi:hypothetical protein
MLRFIAVLLACTVLVVSGVVHGFWTDRFSSTPEPLVAFERMRQLPMTLGEWHGEELPVKPGQAGAGVAGCIQRRYRHGPSGKSVSIALVCGRSGPVSIHTPTVCYPANGYHVQEPKRYGGTGNEFWTADAVKKTSTEETRARIYWGWSNGHGWRASADARQEFVGSAVLFKLYVLREMEGAEEGLKDEPCEQFLRLLLPELDHVLFGPEGA